MSKLQLHILTWICPVSVLTLLIVDITTDIKNSLLTIYAPIGFLIAVWYTCQILRERHMSPSEKLPLKQIGKVLDYVSLIACLITVSLSLALVGLVGSFLPLVTGGTHFLALVAIFKYLEEQRSRAT